MASQMPEFVDRFVDRVDRENGCNGRFDGFLLCYLCRQSDRGVAPGNF